MLVNNACYNLHCFNQKVITTETTNIFIAKKVSIGKMNGQKKSLNIQHFRYFNFFFDNRKTSIMFLLVLFLILEWLDFNSSINIGLIGATFLSFYVIKFIESFFKFINYKKNPVKKILVKSGGSFIEIDLTSEVPLVKQVMEKVSSKDGR